jgi:mannose-6-phosphate isomerase-like protein (cupin superfamily)
MKKVVIVFVIVTAAFTLGRLSAQQRSLASCVMCDAAYVSAAEIARYEELGRSQSIIDQQIRSIDIGKSNVQIALAYRGRLDEPGPRSVAEHSLVTEVYVVLSGSATNRTGPDLVDTVARPPDHRAVVGLNGPGSNSADIRNAATQDLHPGDVFVIPAGTGHQFTKIDDHITYLMVRIDPDKVVPLLDEAGSRAYLDANLGAR